MSEQSDSPAVVVAASVQLPAFEKLPLIAALKEAVAQRTGDASWRAVRPPLVELSPEQRELVRTAASP